MSYLATKRKRDLIARKWQYGAAALTVFLGVMMFAASYDAYRNLDTSYRGTYERLAFAHMTVTGAGEGFAVDVEAVPGVAKTDTRSQADVPLRVGGADGKTLLGRVVGVPVSGQPTVDRLDIQTGAYFGSNEATQAIAEVHFAKTFSLGLGDEVEYFDGAAWRTLPIRGTAVSPEYIWPARSAQEVITAPEDFGVLFVPEALVDVLPEPVVARQTLVLYDAGADVGGTDARVEALATAAGATSIVPQADQPSNKALQLDVSGFAQMAVAFPALFLFAAGMATYTLMTRLVFREREIIGTLRANGLSRRAVVSHYLSYGLWIGTIAGVAGILAGVPLGWASTFAYTAELGLPDTIREFHLVTPLVGIAFGVVTGFLSAWVPARQAAGLDPAEAMRGDVPVGGGRRSLLERLVPPLRRAPVRWRMVLRGIGRNRRRSFSTVLGVVLALVLVLASWGMIDSIVYLLDEQYGSVELQDASIVLDRPVSAEELTAIAEVPGVSRAERVYVMGASVRGEGGTYATQLFGYAKDTRMHGFPGEGLPGSGVLLGTALRDQVGAKVGQNVRITLTGAAAGSETAIDVMVAGFVTEPLGTFAYMSDTALQDALGAPPESAIVMAQVANEADRAATVERIAALDGVAHVTDSRQFYETIKSYMGLFYVFVGMMLVFGGIMAFALIFNTMSVNLAERSGEIATMRANGLSRRQAAALVVSENVLLTLVGIPPGLLLGWWAADALMRSYSSDMFIFTTYIAPQTYVLAALAMLGVTLVSLWPGVRALGRIDIGSIVRQRST